MEWSTYVKGVAAHVKSGSLSEGEELMIRRHVRDERSACAKEREKSCRRERIHREIVCASYPNNVKPGNDP